MLFLSRELTETTQDGERRHRARGRQLCVPYETRPERTFSFFLTEQILYSAHVCPLKRPRPHPAPPGPPADGGDV